MSKDKDKQLQDVIDYIEKELKPSINKEKSITTDKDSDSTNISLPPLSPRIPGLDHPDANVDWGHGITVAQLTPHCKGVMSTMPEIIWKYCNIYKVNPGLIVAISAHETGYGTSNAIRNKNNPMGYMDPATNWKYVKTFPSLQEGYRTCISNISRNYIAKGKNTIEAMAKIYAPLGASNDPNGYNKNWPSGVNKIYKEITGTTYSASMSGTGVKNEQLDPVVGGVEGGVAGDGTGEVSINFDNRESDDLVEVKGVILSFVSPYHLHQVKDYQEAWRTIEEYDSHDRRFHYAIDHNGIKATGDDRKILKSMLDNNTSTYINRALFTNKAEKHCISIGAFIDKDIDYAKTEEVLIRDTARVLHKYGLDTKDLWREFDLNRAPSHLLYLERIDWKSFLQQVDKQLTALYTNYPIQKKDKYEDNVGKKGKIKNTCDLLELPQEGAIIVQELQKGAEYTIKSYSNTWYEIDKPRGWIKVKDFEVESSSSGSSSGLEEEQIESVGTNAVIKFPKINASVLPKIDTIIDHDTFKHLLNYADDTIIENYAMQHEPYDKNLDEIVNATITDDERLDALTSTLLSSNENNVYYSIVSVSPGAGDHCKRAPSELNAVWKSEHLKVEPIYPDLIIPPNYATTDQNLFDPNALPPSVFTDISVIDKIDEEDLLEKLEDGSFKIKMFDYSKVKKEKDTENRKPINYKDPYPYDDKVHELEAHVPKVKIDEIESRLYDCNHIGCPIGQPMAKNFHMLNDALITQSKKVEERLVRLENVMATMVRNIGRLGSRININCVYYGGQDTFGKYKTIRCLKDDRVSDGCSMTLDQCLCCTRYEPILGQIYDILDSTGMNGAFVTDDEQMSYGNAVDFNDITQISTKKEFADVTVDGEGKYESIIDTWEEADKEEFIKELKSKYSGDELATKLEELKDHEYLFRMDWSKSYLETQQPDVKRYPTEGIKAKYKVPLMTEKTEKEYLRSFAIENSLELEEAEEILAKARVADDLSKDPSVESEKELDAEYKKDQENYDKLVAGEWVDTREEADSFEINKYTSEEFYFDGFGTDINSSATNSALTNTFGQSANEIRNKVLEMANKIVQDCIDKKACYSQSPRTVRYDQPQTMDRKDINPNEKVVAYDCSSFVSCCYFYAGLTELSIATIHPTTKTQIQQIRNGGEMWEAVGDEAYAKAIPGDIILEGKGKGDNFVPSHVAIYMGDKKKAHASTRKDQSGGFKQEILISDSTKSSHPVQYFCRSKELKALDEAKSEGSGQFAWPVPSSGRVTDKYGTIRGSRTHGGIDVGAAVAGQQNKDEIVASDSGTVTFAGYNAGGYGYLVKIDHGNGYETRYAHMYKGSLTVKENDKVTKGQKVGMMGSTGRSSGSHLHFEIRKNGNTVDPLSLVEKHPNISYK